MFVFAETIFQLKSLRRAQLRTELTADQTFAISLTLNKIKHLYFDIEKEQKPTTKSVHSLLKQVGSTYE